MADVRALLKAKREEKRISHPFAAYNQIGQLRCTACATVIKHPSAWNGHLGSKSHRTNAARVKEEERLRGTREEEKRHGKRKADEDGEESLDEPAKKRRVDEDDGQQAADTSNVSGFPTDFFSDPSRAVSIREVDSDEEGDEDNPPPAVAASQSRSTLDLEWAKFQETVINTSAETDARETFDRATIFAEPQLSTEIPEGFPSSVAQEPQPEPEAPPTRKDEGAERRRRDEEEKELIMDRLLNEEVAQEEADGRVNVLRAKLDLLKQKRVAAKAAKPKK